MPNIIHAPHSGPARSAIGRAARSNAELQGVPDEQMAAAVAHILSEHATESAKQASEILAKAAGPRGLPPDMKRTRQSLEKAMFTAVLEETIEEISTKPYFDLDSAIGELTMRLDQLRNPQSKPNRNLTEAMEHMQQLQQLHQGLGNIQRTMHDLQKSVISNLR
jgi:hypothetical protein